MAEFLKRLSSRKFLLAFFSGLFIVLNEGLGFGISREVYDELVKIVLGYIAAEGLRDVVEVARKA